MRCRTRSATLWRNCCATRLRSRPRTPSPPLLPSSVTAKPPPARWLTSVLYRALPVADRVLLDAVEPTGAQSLRVIELADVGQVVGDRVEDQIDLESRQVRTDAVVRAGAAEAEMRVRVA